MRVSAAVTDSHDVGWWLALTILLYCTLATALILILRRMATGGPAVATEPKELVPA